MGQPPPIKAEVANRSGIVIAALMVIGVAGGLFLLKPQPGQSRIRTPWFSVSRRSTRPPAAPPQQAPPVASTPSAPSPAPGAPPATHPSLTLRAIPLQAGKPGDAQASAAAERAQREEQMAEAQFKSATNLLSRNQTGPARHALQELIQKYPATRSARDARSLLPQIPDERQPAEVAAARPPAAPPRERPAPSLPGVARLPGSVANQLRTPGNAAPPAEPEPEAGRRVFTGEDLAGGRTPSVQRRTPSIPASLQSSQVPAAAAQSVKAAVQDELRLLKATYDSGGWTVEVEYNLISSHTRAVYLGAWMTDPTVSRRLGYTAAPMSSGRATARISLPGVPPGASNLRIVFFEDKGTLFFTKDFTITK